MQCESCLESLTAWMDGELDSQNQAGLEKHIAQCSDCHQEYRTLLNTYTLTDDLPLLELNPGLWRKIEDGIEPHRSEGPGLLPSLGAFLMGRWPLLTGGAASFALLSVLLLNVSAPDPDRQHSFDSFLQQRERLERQHTRVADQPEAMRVLSSNPFTERDRPTQDSNPFKPSE